MYVYIYIYIHMHMYGAVIFFVNLNTLAPAPLPGPEQRRLVPQRPSEAVGPRHGRLDVPSNRFARSCWSHTVEEIQIAPPRNLGKHLEEILPAPPGNHGSNHGSLVFTED